MGGGPRARSLDPPRILSTASGEPATMDRLQRRSSGRRPCPRRARPAGRTTWRQRRGRPEGLRSAPAGEARVEGGPRRVRLRAPPSAGTRMRPNDDLRPGPGAPDRPPGSHLGGGEARRPRRHPGDRRGRQGRHDQGHRRGIQPAGNARHVVQGAELARAGPRLPVARPPASPRPGARSASSTGATTRTC